MLTKSAVIVENRYSIDKVMDAHAKFLPPDWALVHISQPINSMRQYNELLVSRDFWEAMTDIVLIFQWDSMLLRKGIEAFLEWDYVGAPIPDIGFPAQNGGLSLRRRNAMLAVIDAREWHGENEDVWFCNGLYQLGLNIATYEVAEKFSCETEFRLGTLGYHAIPSWLKFSECEMIRRQYD